MNSLQPAVEEGSNKERQKDEFDSIKAIYPSEVQDLREGRAWATWKPLELLISLTPNFSSSGSDEISTRADLYIRCSENYPDAVPFIDIRNAKGVSEKDVIELKEELRKVALKNLGTEMVLELINYTRNYLSEHKRPQYGCLYDEMLHNKLQQEKETAERELKRREALKVAEEETLQAIEIERHRKLEALRNANRKSRVPDSVLNKSSNETTELIRPRSRSESSCNEECPSTVRTTLKFGGKKEISVLCGSCMGHNKRGCVVYHGMDKNSGKPVVIVKWVFEWTAPHGHYSETIKSAQENIMKQLSNMEKEFKTLRQLNHGNIALYLGMNCVQEKYKINVFLLQEYISGCPLSLLCKGVPLNIQQLQLYTHSILQAIQYLHDSSIVHRNLRSTSIFINTEGDVKVSDYSLDKKLYDLYRSLTNEPEIDNYPPTIGRGGKKSDIYRLGVILLSMSTGSLSKELPPKLPEYLNPSFKDFLSKCLVHDEQKRWSADQLLSHQFLAFSSVPSVLPKEHCVKNVEKEDTLPEVRALCEEYSPCSRLIREFEIIDCLGKGGYGFVVKVKNKLDSRVYALKRIILNPANKQLDRKIKREVTVLSRLNHENIVRYYNSWIEECLVDAASDKNQLSIQSSADSEAAGKSIASVEWEMHSTKEVYSSDEDDDCEEDNSLMLKVDDCSSSSIIFQGSDGEEGEEVTNKGAPADEGPNKPKPVKSLVQRFMFIQMEFCEKSTLRTAIDNGLHKQVTLVWRLFREIIEGLHHIHQQGVIHRDLKPVNIFLDSNDHVKIGDFGLATDARAKPIGCDLNASIDYSIDAVPSLSDLDGLRTGNVGTTLYVAPEIDTGLKVNYNQKVDIYSLGLIFFEMCYPPPVTAMERSKLLGNLRLPSVVLPADHNDKLSEEMVHILKWLLDHDASKRPTSAELLSSEHIPPLLTEEAVLNQLRNTVSEPQSRGYKHMMTCLFNQEVPAKLDFTYNEDVNKSMHVKSRSTQVFSYVANTLDNILRMRGFVHYSVPTLMPKAPVCDNETSVYILDRSGALLNLPHDLRVPFARHIARHREITHLKRFTLEKVYREQKVFGVHPREQYEYAFDIVTPTVCSFMPDAEVLAIVCEIVSQFPYLENRNYTICLNHVSVLKSVLKYSGFDEKEEAIIFRILSSQKNRGLTKLQFQNCLLAELPEKKVVKFMHFSEVTDSFEKFRSLLQAVLQSKDVGGATRKGFKELHSVITAAESFGVKLPICFCLTCAHEAKLYSGVIFQFVCSSKNSKKKAVDILAAGGRYDKLISSFKFKVSAETGKAVNQTAVGVSIAFERIIAAELESAEHKTVDVVVYSDPDMTQEKCSMLKHLWSLGISASSFYDKQMTLNELVDYCQNNTISHLITLSKTDQGVFRVRSFEKEKMVEKRLGYSDLKDFFAGKLNISKAGGESTQSARTEYQRSSSVHMQYSPMLNVRFLPQDKLLKRKWDGVIRSHVTSCLQPFTNRNWEIVATSLNIALIGAVVSSCDVGEKSIESIHQSFTATAEKHSKYKAYLMDICDEVVNIKEKNSSVILYSIPESNFRVVL